MKMKRAIILLLFLLSSVYSLGQGFTYSYEDPCTFKTKEIYIPNPNGSVALSYNGQNQSFTPSQLQSGALENWINQVNSQNPAGPCSGIGLSQNTTINAIVVQNNIAVITTVLSALGDISSVSSIGGASIEGIIQADEKVSSNNDENEDNPKTKNNGTNNTNGTNSTTTNGNTGTSQSGGNKNNGSGVGNGTNPQGGTTPSSNVPSTTGGQPSQSPVTNTPQVPTNNPPSNPVTSGNQVGGQTTNNQGNNSVSSNNPVTSGNNTTSNTNNSTAANTNNSTSSQTNQNSQNGGQNNQNSPVVSGNQNSQGGVSNITGGVNSVRADAVEKKDKEESKIEDVTSSSSQSSSSTKSKVAAVKKGSLMMTGDIVTISSASGVDPAQVKVNMSIISSNTKNTFAKGALLNFTTSINNSNLTLFVSYRHKKSTTIFANSSMINFDKDFFNTFSLMESYRFGKITGTVGVNLTMGNIGDSKFTSLSTLAGVMGGFKLNKKMNMTTMFVMVYSPYVYYYEGLWHQSGYLAVPFVAVDYRLTKKFKLNLSFSGINQINDQTLNYQVLIGAKALL
jgi:hypothetical protein